ncbi:MAG: amidohydrolase family protein [Myxococcota bacterium]|jgi:5-methylthioadenosine/S-adenosylhomocysteine deaminase|nr:amidohydrolase family protein [Myxococcota bacterium]
METPRFTVCRARFLLPLAAPDRTRRVADGYVLAEGDRLREVGPYTPETGRRLLATYGAALRVLGPATAAEPIPCLDGVLLPAFVKAHGHDHEQPLIGIAKDEPLTAWLDLAVNPFSAFMNEQQERLTELLGCSPQLATYRLARVCDIHYGITACLVHHCNHNKGRFREIAQANEAAGTTMIAALGSQDRYYDARILDRPEQALARLDAAAALPGLTRTRFCPGPDQFFSNSRELLVPLKQWAREHGTLFHTHSSEEPKTTRWFQEAIEPGFTEVQWAQSLGLLDEQTILAHQVNCGPQDVAILAATGARVVHNPLANTILGSGMPPVIEMLAAGVPVAISTDGSGSADNQNILLAARLAAQYQKARHQDATLLPAQQLLEMITSVPAQMLGLDQGELLPGKAADWILLRLDRPNLVPTRLDNLAENLIWAADGSEVELVVAGGRVLKEQGRVLPFRDGTRPEDVMRAVQLLSEQFVEAQREAPELRGTGAHQ